MKSHRIEEIFTLIETKKIKVLSLDIFDTLLWRQVSHPTHVFYLTALHLKRKYINLFDIDPQSFMQERIKAEEHARLNHTEFNHEVTIHEIYDCLNTIYNIDNEALIQTELDTEIEVLRPNSVICQLIDYCNREQIKIVLCSDMYWPNSQLRTIVEQVFKNAGKDKFDFELLVSCDYRTGKHNGGLYRELVKCCDGVSKDEIFHIGDNHHSDVVQAEKSDIRSYHFRRTTPLFEKFLEREKNYNRHSDYELNLGLDSLRLQSVFDYQKTTDNFQKLNHHQYGSFILGPIFTLFAEWLVDIAVSRNQTVIYCLMRDGYLISRLVNKICQSRGLDIEAREIWVSRRIIKRASLFRADRSELQGLFENRCNPNLPNLTKDLGIKYHLLQNLTGITHQEPLSHEEVALILNEIENNRVIRKGIVNHSNQVRRNLINYLSNEGFFNNPKNIIVDLGWGGTIQKRLQKIFDWENISIESFGLYLATHTGIKSLNDSCTEHKGFLTDQGEEAYACNAIIFMPEILEQACMDRRGTLKEITEDGKVLTEDNLIPEEQLDALERMQRGIYNFCNLWLRTHPEVSFTSKNRTILKQYLLSILIPSIKTPLPQEAELFSQWGHDTNDGTDEVEPIIGKFHVRNKALTLTREQILGLSRMECYWPEGLLALLDGHLGYHNYTPQPHPVSNNIELYQPPVDHHIETTGLVHAAPEHNHHMHVNDGADSLLAFYVTKYECLPGWYKKGGHLLKLVTGNKRPFSSKNKRINRIREKAKVNGTPSRYNEIKLWYAYEYEKLPSWYKKFGSYINNN